MTVANPARTSRGEVSEGVSSTRVYDAFGQAVSGTGTWAGPSGYGGAFGYREDDGPAPGVPSEVAVGGAGID